MAFISIVSALWLACAPSQGPRSGQMNQTHIAVATYEEAVNVVSRIHEGMTFEDISKMIPITTLGPHVVEHGGIWYDSPLGEIWMVQLRFELPSAKTTLPNCKLNFPPRVRSRSDESTK